MKNFDWETFKNEKILVFFNRDKEDIEIKNFLKECDKQHISWVDKEQASSYIPEKDFNYIGFKQGIFLATDDYLEEDDFQILLWSDYMEEGDIKSMLEDWMLVVYRSGQKKIVTDNCKILRDENGEDCNSLSNYNENLLHRYFRNLDIIEIYDVPLDRHNFSLDFTFRELLWKREEKENFKKITIEEIEEILGTKIKIVNKK